MSLSIERAMPSHCSHHVNISSVRVVVREHRTRGWASVRQLRQRCKTLSDWTAVSDSVRRVLNTYGVLLPLMLTAFQLCVRVSLALTGTVQPKFLSYNTYQSPPDVSIEWCDLCTSFTTPFRSTTITPTHFA